MRLGNYVATVMVAFTQYNNDTQREGHKINHWDHLFCHRAVRRLDSVSLKVAHMSVEKRVNFYEI